MAERNLFVVANRVLRLLRSKDNERTRSLASTYYPEILQGLENTISMLAPLLLDAEKKSPYDTRISGWLRDLGKALNEAENLLELVIYEEALQRLSGIRSSTRSIVKKVTKQARTIPSSTQITRWDMLSIKGRINDIAAQRHPFNLEELKEKEIRVPAAMEDEESWSWLKGMAYQPEPIPGTEVIRKEIAKIIGENEKSFAAMAIGSMLYYEGYCEEAERRVFYENELKPWMSKNIYLQEVNPFLKLSYDHLPSPLKQCFAYCSLFPRDHEIDVQTMIQLWMAQGFIEPREKSDDLEDIGYEYFLNLLGRYFFHISKLDGRWRITKCRYGDNLPTFLAENWCCLITSYASLWESGPLSHVSLASYIVSPENFPFPSILRSILFPTRLQREHNGRPNYLTIHWDKVIKRCEFLRALDMHAFGLKIVPYSIGELKHLRYLDLSDNWDLMELPDSIAKLLNLQTLKLSSCFKLKELPRDIANLVNLRHLDFDGCYSLTSLPRGFGQLTNLRNLSQIVLSDDTSKANYELKELKQLSNLREVRIKNLRHGMGEKIASCFEAMKRVRSLSLEWESRAPESKHNQTRLTVNQFPDLEELTLNCLRDLSGMFSGQNIPRNLSKIVLRRCANCQILPKIDQCSKLRVLVLDEMTDLEFISESFVNKVDPSLHESSVKKVYPSLHELWLTELPKLKRWWKSTEVNDENLPLFPHLSKLVIEDCPNLASMPLFPNLEEGLVIDSTSLKPFELTMKVTQALLRLKSLCIININELDDSKAEKIWRMDFQSVELLKLDFLQNLKVLPEGLRRLYSLKELHLWRCGVKEIPEWISRLERLEKLVIRVCPNLVTLPEEIKGLRSLKTLEIEDCPTLLRRCEEGIGADWCKIAHIPERRLGRISRK